MGKGMIEKEVSQWRGRRRLKSPGKELASEQETGTMAGKNVDVMKGSSGMNKNEWDELERMKRMNTVQIDSGEEVKKK